MKLYIEPQKLQNLAEKYKEEFKSGLPYPHIVIDDFLDPEALELLLAEFPDKSKKVWHDYQSHYENKQELNGEGKMGEFTQHLLYQFNSAPFLQFLETLSGIENLIPDPYFFGGGIHQLNRGGKLAVHADYSKHVKWPLDRRLNAILYLNKDWKEEYNGHLELWNTDVTKCEKKVLPIFNRLLIFAVTDFNMHGVPEVLNCPENMSRKSLAFFYFSNGRPASEIDYKKKLHVKFQDRPGDYTPENSQNSKNIIGYESNAFKRLVKQLTPPLIWDFVKSVGKK
jgi:Rps23 Pro-64 3,4-dihydroxylase Tpa1-like proline 4-hydroxylase